MCSVHVLRAITRQLQLLTRDHGIQQLVKMFISLIIHSTSLASAERIFIDMIIAFYSKFETNAVQTALKNMKSMYSDAENIKFEESNDEMMENLVPNDDTEDIEEKLRHGSPYYQFFAAVFDKTVKHIDNKQTSHSSALNPYYLPRFLAYFLEYYLPFFPLWSALLIRCFGLTRDSNQPVENFFKHIKHFVFQLKTRIQVARFVQKMAQNMKGRLRQRKYTLTTERQRQNKLKRTMTPRKDELIVEDISNIEESPNVEQVKRKKGVPWDLASESWNRGKSFFRTPKSINEAHEAYLDEVLQRSVVKAVNENLETEDLSIDLDIVMFCRNELDMGTAVPPPHLNDLLKVKEYPQQFPFDGTLVFGENLSKRDWSQLLPNEEIGDGVMNAFMSLVQFITENSQLRLLSFNTFFAQQIFDLGKPGYGYDRWATKGKICEYPVWLVPINSANGTHWSLAIVVFEHECIIYIDSMHWGPDKGKPKNSVITGLMNFISKHKKCKKKIDFSGWVVYAPIDIPLQVSENGSTSNNCGVHVMTWAYIIATSSYVHFDEGSMPHMRKAIAHLLYAANKYDKKLKKMDKIKDEIWKFNNISKRQPVREPTAIRKSPFSSQSTLEYLVSLKELLAVEHGYQTRSQNM